MKLLKEKIIYFLKSYVFRKTKPQLIATLKIFVDNKLVSIKHAESLTANFLQLLYAYMNDFGTDANFPASGAPFLSKTNAKNIGGTLSAPLSSHKTFRLNGAAGDTERGILFGTGTTAPTPEDYVTESLIVEGAGVGQFNYGVNSSLNGVNIVGNTTSVIIQRSAVNNSGADITVSEVCLNVKHGFAGDTYLVFRDSINELVEDTKTITAQLQFSVIT